MKKAILFIFIVISFTDCHTADKGKSVKNFVHLNIATYNLRYDTPKDSVNHPWKKRFPMIASIIKKYNFEIFGIQEGLLHQLNDLQSLMSDYEYIGEGRSGGDKGEFSAIFYNKNKLKLLKDGSFFLSETPDIVSKGWDAHLTRITSWGLFKEISSGTRFYFFNTHLDNVGKKSRLESVKLILKKIIKIAKDNPVILTGDFNCDQNSLPYKVVNSSGILKDTYDLAKVKHAPTGTFNDYGTKHTDRRIDQIFVSSQIEVEEYDIITDKVDGKFPSDHYPVRAKIKIK
jgi:endonuclease/exonuclease/phosphatase family metal-dependent hydrolase